MEAVKESLPQYRVRIQKIITQSREVLGEALHASIQETLKSATTTPKKITEIMTDVMSTSLDHDTKRILVTQLGIWRTRIIRWADQNPNIQGSNDSGLIAPVVQNTAARTIATITPLQKGFNATKTSDWASIILGNQRWAFLALMWEIWSQEYENRLNLNLAAEEWEEFRHAAVNILDLLDEMSLLKSGWEIREWALAVAKNIDMLSGILSRYLERDPDARWDIDTDSNPKRHQIRAIREDLDGYSQIFRDGTKNLDSRI